MYVEWWMWLVFLAWWFLSINHLSRAIRKNAFEDGVNKGTESTLTILENQGIIRIDGEIINPGEKK